MSCTKLTWLGDLPPGGATCPGWGVIPTRGQLTHCAPCSAPCSRTAQNSRTTAAGKARFCFRPIATGQSSSLPSRCTVQPERSWDPISPRPWLLLLRPCPCICDTTTPSQATYLRFLLGQAAAPSVLLQPSPRAISSLSLFEGVSRADESVRQARLLIRPCHHKPSAFASKPRPPSAALPLETLGGARRSLTLAWPIHALDAFITPSQPS
jgi:hypothetical protein